MDGDQLIIDIGARLVDFQKSMSDASSSASATLSKIEARGAEAAKKLDAGFAGVGKNAGLQTLSKGFVVAEKEAGSLVTRLKQVNDALNATKATAASGFAAGQGATLSGLAQQVGSAGSLRNFIGLSGGALGVGAIAAGVVAEQTKALADLQELADRARVTAAQMAGLQHVFGKLGLSSVDTGKMVEGFSDRLNDAKARGGDLAAALNTAGIAFVQADGSLRPTIEVLSDVAHYMRSSSDEAGKLKLATAAVGDQFAGPFADAVKKGGSALDNLQASTNRVGSAISNDLARMADNGMKSLDALSAHMDTMYSRMKELMGLSLSAQDQVNVAEAHVSEAQGHIVNLQMASNLRDVSHAEMKEAYDRLLAAGKELSERSPVRVLSGVSPGEVQAAPPAAPAPTTAKPASVDDNPPSSRTGGHSRASSSGDGDEDKSADVIAKLRLELQLAQSTGEAYQKITDELKAEEKLKEAGVTASSAEGKTIADLVRQTDAATEAEKRRKQALEASKKVADTIGQSLEGSVESIVLDSKRLTDVFKSLAQDLERMALKAVLTGGGPFGGLFSSMTGAAAGSATGGLFGAAFGGLSHLFGHATGGEIRGAGSGTSDSIVARLSNGEFVVNAKAAQANLGLLHAMNGTGPVPKFASGGQVGAILPPSLGGSPGSGSHTFNISAPVTVNGQSGDNKQNDDLARKMSAQLTDALRKQVVGEIAKQLRPGNMLQSVHK